MLLLLVAACMVGDEGEEKKDDGTDIVPDPDPIAVYTVNGGADGQDMDAVATPAELCGGNEYLGMRYGAAACQEEGRSGVLEIMSDTNGKTWPRGVADEADMCPEGWDYRGGNGTTTACVSVQAAHTAILSNSATGESYEDAESAGDICPSGSTWLGGSINRAPLCAYDGWGSVVNVSTTVDGTEFVEADGNGQEVCGTWEFVGTWDGRATCRVTSGTALYLYRNLEGVEFDGDNGSEICPEGWDYSGAFFNLALCWNAEKVAQVNLYFSANGEEYGGDLEIVDGFCPAGWTPVGDDFSSLMCVQ